jgi:hypothetical protein
MSDRDPGADRRRTDRLVTGTVNASTADVVTAAELARWIRTEALAEPRARVALSTFFLEVPLGTQVAFLAQHGVDEPKALALAKRLEPLGRRLPLASRERW